MLGNDSLDRDFLLDVVRRAPILAALRGESLTPRDLRERLDVSKSTAHRNTTSMAERGLLRKSDGEYALTELGRSVADVVATFETDVQTTVRLAPLLDAVSGIDPPCPVDAFTDATVTTTEQGDPFGPLARLVSLIDEADWFRMADSYAIAPAYIDEVQGRVLDGLEAEVVERPEVLEDIMENHPRRCVQLCGSEFFTIKVLKGLPFGLVVLDDRVGVGIRDPDTGTPHTFVDTDADEAREWAETMFESYWDEATHLDHFTPKALGEAIEAQAE